MTTFLMILTSVLTFVSISLALAAGYFYGRHEDLEFDLYLMRRKKPIKEDTSSIEE